MEERRAERIKVGRDGEVSKRVGELSNSKFFSCG